MCVCVCVCVVLKPRLDGHGREVYRCLIVSCWELLVFFSKVGVFGIGIGVGVGVHSDDLEGGGRGYGTYGTVCMPVPPDL